MRKTIADSSSESVHFSWKELDVEKPPLGVVSDPLSVATLLETRMHVQPYVAAGSATTFMATLVSDEVAQQLQKAFERSTEVQQAFSVVLDRFLMVTEGKLVVNGENCERASEFIVAVQSTVDSPARWPLTTIPSSLSSPVSIGVIRIDSRFSTESSHKVGVSLHNRVYAMLSAKWRYTSRHFVWCIGQRNEFDLTKAAPEKSAEWARRVIGSSGTKLAKAGIFSSRQSLYAKDPNSHSFVIIVTWDPDFCEDALDLFVNILKRLHVRQDVFYRAQWTVRFDR